MGREGEREGTSGGNEEMGGGGKEREGGNEKEGERLQSRSQTSNFYNLDWSFGLKMLENKNLKKTLRWVCI